MIKTAFDKLSQEIEDVTNNFEDTPWTDNVKLLKEDFDINSIKTPKHYLKVADEIEELLRETQLLFIFSVLNKVCKEEGKLYHFETPYQANMKYDGVMKKGENFYLHDEDGDFREVFTSSNFAKFIDDLYWDIYE